MKKGLCILLMGLALGACKQMPNNGPIMYRGDALKGVIVVDRSVVTASETGLPVAQVVLKNTSGVSQKFEYKVIWLDANDMPINEANWPWHPASVMGKDQMGVTSTGPSSLSKKFQVQVRKTQEVK